MRKGQVHSPKARAKISVALKGRVPSPEALTKRSAALKGKIPWNKKRVRVYINGRPETSVEYRRRRCATDSAFAAAQRKAGREHWAKLRAEVIAAYGGRCVCCGEGEPVFLALDHVNDDGRIHRSKIGNGSAMCRWARMNGYPKSLQLLCHNCNYAKAHSGCPHKKAD